MRPERRSCPSWPVPASGSRCSSGAVVGYRRMEWTPPSSYGRTAEGEGGPSRADGIKVPSLKSELLTGKPEGPR